jgi:hypothetical protein
MAIAKELPDVDPMFMQECPACGRMNRMVVKGVYIRDGKKELYPDIGYSFCNCKAIFYTNYENIKDGKKITGFQYYEKPFEEMRNVFEAMVSGNAVKFNIPDPFFCEWGQDPYHFEHWNPRKNRTLFDFTQLCEDLEDVGFELLSARRVFDVDSKDPQTMEIILRKP